MAEDNKKERAEINYYKPFPKRLRELLDRKGETQGKLADYLGVKRQTIGYWKDGVTSPDVNGIIGMADYYNVSTDFLLGRSEVETLDIDIQAIHEKTGLSEKAINNILNALPIPTSSDGDEAIGAHMDALNMLLEDIQFYQLLLSIRLLYISAENMKAFEIENQAFGIPGNILINFLDIIHGNSPTINPTEYYNFACIQLEKDFIDIVKSNIDGHLDSISDIEKQLSDRKNSFMEQSEKLRKKFEEE